jgi:hypothetical protein
MKLTRLALMALRGSDTEIVTRLAEALCVSESTVYRYLKDNSDDLTKAAALIIIRKETGLTDEQILEVEPETKGAA